MKNRKKSLKIFSHQAESTALHLRIYFRNILKSKQPVLVYVDMPYLPYLPLNKASHFGGHAIVIFGYDDKQEMLFVSDRDHSDFPADTPKGGIAEAYLEKCMEIF